MVMEGSSPWHSSRIGAGDLFLHGKGGGSAGNRSTGVGEGWLCSRVSVNQGGLQSPALQDRHSSCCSCVCLHCLCVLRNWNVRLFV